ncbi:hypothetical protein SZN_35662 [Streptomyces zinciresistens K42]|uniref:Uncharacterized protein n=1 Tax=Streptomyces zinciresistens K42 TaxID=700597 RepID=G2GNM7_9ACTN|nr:hypothetical protein SZN_35662 [Streptomyces zinciresistens K42]
MHSPHRRRVPASTRRRSRARSDGASDDGSDPDPDAYAESPVPLSPPGTPRGPAT